VLRPGLARLERGDDEARAGFTSCPRGHRPSRDGRSDPRSGRGQEPAEGGLPACRRPGSAIGHDGPACCS
jgi:hypothetical protein